MFKRPFENLKCNKHQSFNFLLISYVTFNSVFAGVHFQHFGDLIIRFLYFAPPLN